MSVSANSFSQKCKKSDFWIVITPRSSKNRHTSSSNRIESYENLIQTFNLFCLSNRIPINRGDWKFVISFFEYWLTQVYSRREGKIISQHNLTHRIHLKYTQSAKHNWMCHFVLKYLLRRKRSNSNGSRNNHHVVISCHARLLPNLLSRFLSFRFISFCFDLFCLLLLCRKAVTVAIVVAAEAATSHKQLNHKPK